MHRRGTLKCQSEVQGPFTRWHSDGGLLLAFLQHLPAGAVVYFHHSPCLLSVTKCCTCGLKYGSHRHSWLAVLAAATARTDAFHWCIIIMVLHYMAAAAPLHSTLGIARSVEWACRGIMWVAPPSCRRTGTVVWLDGHPPYRQDTTAGSVYVSACSVYRLTTGCACHVTRFGYP